MNHSHGWGKIVLASITSTISGMGSRFLELATDAEFITLVSAWIGIGSGLLTTLLLWFKVRNEMKARKKA